MSPNSAYATVSIGVFDVGMEQFISDVQCMSDNESTAFATIRPSTGEGEFDFEGVTYVALHVFGDHEGVKRLTESLLQVGMGKNDIAVAPYQYALYRSSVSFEPPREHQGTPYPSDAVQVNLHKAPGSRIMSLFRFLCSKKSISEIFEPIHADFIEEYFEALDAGGKWKSRWVRVRYYWAFLSASGLLGAVGIAKKVVKFWQQVA